jgi:aminoglycoside phosphotransferase (APT) family kinase protein
VTPIPDLEAVRDFLRDWSEDRAPLDGLDVGHVKLGPGAAMRVLYEAPGADGETLRVVARHTSRKKGRRLEAQINARCPAAGAFPRGAVYDPELGLLFQVFPADWRLETLPTAVDAAAMAPRLEAALAASARGARVRAVAAHPLRYKPQRKCLLRYDIAWAGPHADEAPAVVYARVVRAEGWAPSHDPLRRLWAVRDLLSLDLPEPLATFDDLRAEVFGAVPGEQLFAITDRADFPALAARAGHGLSELHNLPVTLAGAFDPKATPAMLAGAATEFARLLPAQAGRIGALGAALGRRVDAAPGARPCPVHGDFHGNNLLVDGDRIALIDFEDATVGDPAEDVAANWAQPCWQLDATLAGAREAFVAAYLEAADPATAARVPVLGAAYLFLNAFQAMRRGSEARQLAKAEALLDACEAAL